ncbi:MAG: DUF3747 domain-containing protein [Okeania sp. SIO2C9]|uniref:DUF3747 domain-containing protein n=1 Tax=Okeania sp. SIO2C9 TaxID=2607791 RepID=UPI0013BFB197|nr:DUF3747 domain-containing protein [Okeania sp. SIO2C9]NEQ74203.1 DUF3747 domain-containing protein [Okeania sp. SIO2C9]
MKTFFKQSIAALTTLGVLTFFSLRPAPVRANFFDQKEVEQSRYIAIAIPRAFGPQLLILEQKTDARQCWGESGDRPVLVDPLLLNFDFTGICGRATDSNGYSIRMAGTDLALEYALSLQMSGGDIRLMGISRYDSNAPRLLIGRTYGLADGFTKIILEPGWRFAKRSYGGKELGHIYVTHDWLPTELETSNNN